MGAVGEAAALVGSQQGFVEGDVEEGAEAPQAGGGVAHQIFVAELQHPPIPDLPVQGLHVVVAVAPDRFSQPVRVGIAHPQKPVHAQIHEGADHGIGVADQMDVARLLEPRLGLRQGFGVQGIGG